MTIIFRPPFPDFFFHPDRIFPHSLATMFTITGITSIVLKFVVISKELSLKGLPKNRKGQWWQKGIYSCPLKWMFDANLCILCTAFLQKLHCARVSHGIVLKMADLSILMEPTLLSEKGSATVSYNAFWWCWYLNVHLPAPTHHTYLPIFKTRNGESGNGNEELGTGNWERGMGNL